MIRAIEHDDIQAAVRGLGMRSLKLSDDELWELIKRHASRTHMFASQVICAAARQILVERAHRST